MSRRDPARKSGKPVPDLSHVAERVRLRHRQRAHAEPRSIRVGEKHDVKQERIRIDIEETVVEHPEDRDTEKADEPLLISAIKLVEKIKDHSVNDQRQQPEFRQAEQKEIVNFDVVAIEESRAVADDRARLEPLPGRSPELIAADEAGAE